METPFSELVQVCKALESTTKRLEKRRVLGEFLQGVNPDVISPAVLLVIGRIFPKAESKTLHVGWRTVKKAEIVGNMLEDEKVYGTCHIAIGSNYDEDVKSFTHLDGLVWYPTITAIYPDDSEETIMKDGKLV